MVEIPYISSIRLNNFLSHKNTILELKPGFNLLVGNNGTGKTAFIQATDFLVSGKKDRYKKWDHYITDGEKNASVIITIETKNESYQFERRIERKPSGLVKSNYYLNGKRKKLSQIRKKIISLGFNILNPLVAVRQTNISRLMSELNSKTVLDAIEELSGIKEKRIRIEKVSEEIEDSKKKIKDLILKKEHIKWKIEKLEDEKRLFQRYEAVNKGIQNLIAEENYYKIIELRENAKKYYYSIQRSSQTISSLRLNLETRKKEQELIENNVEDLDSLKTILKSDSRAIQEEIGKIGGKTSFLQEEIRKTLINSQFEFELDRLQNLIRADTLKIEHLNKNLESLEVKKGNLSVSEKDIKNFKLLLDQKRTIVENLTENASNFLNEVKKFNEIKIDIDIDTVLANIESLDDASLLQWINNVKKADFESMKSKMIEHYSNYQTQLFKINDSLEKKKSQLSDLKQAVNKIKKEGKNASLPNEVARIKNNIRNENIDALGPICHYITFKGKEFETAARFMVSEQVWYSFVALSKTARQLIRELRGNSTKLRVILNKSKFNIPQELGVKSEFGRLIDGIEAESEIKGYIYEIMGNVQVAISQEEADWLMGHGKSAITLDGVYCRPSQHYETDFKKFKAKVNLTSEDTRKYIQDLQNEIRELQDEKKRDSKEKRLIESTIKSLDTLRTILDRIIHIVVKFKKNLDEEERIQDEINSLDSSIEKYLNINKDLEGLSVEIQNLSPRLEEMKKIQNLQDQLEIEQNKAKELELTLRELSEKLTTINQQYTEGQHKLQTQESIKKQIKEQIDELLLQQIQNEENILQIEKQLKDLSGIASKISPMLTKSEVKSNLDKLFRERAIIGTPDLKVLKKLRTEINNLKKLQIRTKREEKNILKLEEKVVDTVEEWKTRIQDILFRTEKGIQSILKNEEINVRLHFQSKGKGLKAFRMSTVEILSRKKNNPAININGMSPGEKSLIGMALLLGMQEALPKGGIRLLDEFDESLDRNNTIFIRELIMDRASQIQYLVLTPGKFPELGVGANIIRIQREHNDTKIWHGWPVNTKVMMEG